MVVSWCANITPHELKTTTLPSTSFTTSNSFITGVLNKVS